MPEAGAIGDAVRRPCLLRAELPAATAENVPVAISTRPRPAVRGCADVVCVPAVLHPLPDVAQHVVEAEGILPKHPHGGRERIAVLAFVVHLCVLRMPIAVIKITVIDVLAQKSGIVGSVSRRGRVRSRGILPFRFREEAIFAPRLPTEPCHVGLGVVPAHAHDGMMSILFEARTSPSLPRYILPRLRVVRPLELLTRRLEAARL